MLDAQDALDRLRAGNQRFVSDVRANEMHSTTARRLELASGQEPFAIILGCSDSRVPAEIVFDQGLGDLFVIRVAGNIVNDDILGSMEFACRAAGAKLIAVIGHSKCGAVKGACGGAELGHLTGLLGRIQPAVAAVPAVADRGRFAGCGGASAKCRVGRSLARGRY